MKFLHRRPNVVPRLQNRKTTRSKRHLGEGWQLHFVRQIKSLNKKDILCELMKDSEDLARAINEHETALELKRAVYKSVEQEIEFLEDMMSETLD